VVLGGEVRELSMIFTDIRNFTTVSETLSAAELTRVLNEMLTPLTDIIFEHGDGTLDKYMGDGIMAFWNAPLDDPLHAHHACEAARAMRIKMDELNNFWRARSQKDGSKYSALDIGIGINTGLCCVGNLGSTQHYDYSAIGDSVNLTSRLEGMTRYYNLPAIVGEETRKRIDAFDFLEVDLMRVKGRAGASHIYTFVDMIKIEDGQRENLMTSHRLFFECYRKMKWKEASAALSKCREFKVTALETLYAIYDERITQLVESPLPDDWDGVYTALQK
jgi:adenylate cyclase